MIFADDESRLTTEVAPVLLYNLTMEQPFAYLPLRAKLRRPARWLADKVSAMSRFVNSEKRFFRVFCHRTEAEIIFLSSLLFVVFWTEVAITGKQ